MRTPAQMVFLAAVAAALACQAQRDPTEAEVLDTDLMERTCEAWCETAVECSVHYAGPEWGNFTTQAECEQTCVLHITSTVERVDGSCLDRLVNHRECGASLTCEEFESYENYAFNEPLDQFPPCKAEHDELTKTACY